MITHLVFDGVADGPLGVALDIVTSAERLVRAGLVSLPRGAASIRQRVVSIDGKPVVTRAGRRCAVDGSLASIRLGRGHVLALPGLGTATGKELREVLERTDVRRAIPRLRQASASGTLLAASCSSTFLLAAAGVLEGREATTTWWLAPVFAKRFPDVALSTDRMVVDAGPVLTAGSALAHADLLLAVVARRFGPTLAHLVAKYLVLDERPSQARYMVSSHVRTSDASVRKLESYLRSHLEEPLTVATMARVVGASPRTLARRLHAELGTTPLGLLQRLRMERALHLLETTDRPVERIAEDVGYADPSAFRRIFQRELGESPGAVRRRVPSHR